MTQAITVAATVAADKEKVWHCYTDPAHIVNWNFADPSWHCPSAANDLKIGGRYVARMEARDGSFGFDFEAVYTEMNIGAGFAYQFGECMATVTFKAQNGATEVVVTFEPETEHALELQQAGWQVILNNFKAYVEAN